MSEAKQYPDPRSGNAIPMEGPRAAAITACILGMLVLWSFWPTLELLAERWWIDPQYSHGFLVPIFAAIILWLKKPATVAWQPNPWGLALLVGSLALRWFSARMDLIHVDGVCLIGTLLGATLLAGGWSVLRWAGPAILFLGFMVPLPDVLNDGIAIPLRGLATVVSTYVLQTFGYPAMAEGNTIQIDDIRLGVIEACSGLGMLMTFFALATAMAIVVPGPIADRLILVASAIPIAVFANVVRIIVVAMADVKFGKHHHDVIDKILGWPMMPLALGLLWLELKFLKLLFVSTADVAPLAVPLSPWLQRTASPKKPLWS